MLLVANIITVLAFIIIGDFLFPLLFRNVEIQEITNFALSVRLIVEHIMRFFKYDGAVALQKVLLY